MAKKASKKRASKTVADDKIYIPKLTKEQKARGRAFLVRWLAEQLVELRRQANEAERKRPE